MSKPVSYIADHLRRVLIDGGSAPHTAEVQWFFKDEIQSRGWYTGEIRKLARRFGRVIRREEGIDYLIGVADHLFHGNVLEEKVLAVLLLEPYVGEFSSAHFKLFEEWLDRVSTWADHDGLVQYIIGHMIVADPRRLRRVFVWSRSRNRWKRRAAAVALLRGRTRDCSGTRYSRLRRRCWKTRTTWCAKGWDGCCGRRRALTVRGRCRC